MNYKEPNLSFFRKALGTFGIFILMLGCTPDDPPGGSEGDIANGKDDFSSGCISCHAPVGNGTFVNLDIDQLTSSTAEQIGLVDYIRQYMPPTPDSEQRCGQACATNIVAYLRDEKSQGGSVAIDGDAHLRGAGRFDEACETCHQGERTLGLFDEASLASKNIYRRDQLIEYIAQSMPPNNPSACTGACAEEIAAYIYTWSVLPIDPAAGRDLVSGRQDKPIKSYQCNQSQAFGDRQLKLLNHQEYANSLRDLFNYTEDLSTLLPAEGTVGNFKNNRQIFILSDIDYSGLIQAAEKVAEWAVSNRFNFLGCSNLDQNCSNRFISDLAPRIFRRSLTSEERSTYAAMAGGQETNGDVQSGMQIALAAMLSSPQFLYRHEIGDPSNALGSGGYELTSFEIATFLSYTFTRSTPKGSLWQAALNDQLRDANQIRSEASALLDTPDAQAIIDEFVHDWLSTPNLLLAHKDLWANEEAVKEAMLTEISLVFRDVMLNENRDFADLYSPGRTYLNSVLANHYGISGVSGSNFSEVTTNERGGIMLSGAFLSHHADNDEASPIRRAVYVRRDLLCQYMPPPPPDVSVGRDAKTAELAEFFEQPSTTNRMRFHRLTEGQVCRDCHAELINTLGFGLEDYDGFGVYRQVDTNGNSITPTGRLYSPYHPLQFYGDPERNILYHEFYGGRGLARLLASGEVSDLAKSCLAMQVYNYATGVLVDSITDSESVSAQNLEAQEREGYNCDIQNMVDDLDRESPRAMLESLGGLDSVRFRKAWNR